MEASYEAEEDAVQPPSVLDNDTTITGRQIDRRTAPFWSGLTRRFGLLWVILDHHTLRRNKVLRRQLFRKRTLIQGFCPGDGALLSGGLLRPCLDRDCTG
jgi:hypothetical protein